MVKVFRAKDSTGLCAAVIPCFAHSLVCAASAWHKPIRGAATEPLVCIVGLVVDPNHWLVLGKRGHDTFICVLMCGADRDWLTG